MKSTSPVPSRLSVPPRWGVPVPGLSACKPLFRLTAVVGDDDDEPPQAAARSDRAPSTVVATVIFVWDRFGAALAAGGRVALEIEPAPDSRAWPARHRAKVGASDRPTALTPLEDVAVVAGAPRTCPSTDPRRFWPGRRDRAGRGSAWSSEVRLSLPAWPPPGADLARAWRPWLLTGLAGRSAERGRHARPDGRRRAFLAEIS